MRYIWDGRWWDVNGKKWNWNKVDLKITFKWNENDGDNEIRMDMGLKNGR